MGEVEAKVTEVLRELAEDFDAHRRTNLAAQIDAVFSVSTSATIALGKLLDERLGAIEQALAAAERAAAERAAAQHRVAEHDDQILSQIRDLQAEVQKLSDEREAKRDKKKRKKATK